MSSNLNTLVAALTQYHAAVLESAIVDLAIRRAHPTQTPPIPVPLLTRVLQARANAVAEARKASDKELTDALYVSGMLDPTTQESPL
jgi:hypothetical protein